MFAPQIKNLFSFGRRAAIQTSSRNTAEWVNLCDFQQGPSMLPAKPFSPHIQWLPLEVLPLKPSY